MEVMGLNIGTPESIVLAFSGYSILKSCFNHGKKAGLSWPTTLAGLFVIPAALAFGGFFDSLGWPQIIYCALLVVQLIGLWPLIKMNSKTEYNAPVTILMTAAILGLYTWGGFFS